jgi:hypothetical protein
LAFDCADEARHLSKNGTAAHVEALLALGHCELCLDHREAAKKSLDLARDWADALKTPKLQVHAGLLLAELACDSSAPDLHAAAQHFERAERLILEHRNFHHFLLEKRDLVRAQIAALAERSGYFLVHRSDVLRPGPEGFKRLDILELKIKKWAIDVGRDVKGSLEKAAELFDVTPNTVTNIRNRYKALTQGSRTPDEPRD